MSISISTHIAPYLNTLHGIYQRYPRTIIISSVTGLLLPWLVGNYNAFIALGGGGLPSNVFGWLIALTFKPLGRETLSTDEYHKDPDQESWLKDPGSIPERRGSRPKTGWHFLPHRQVDKMPNNAVRELLDVTFQRHADSNPTLVKVILSPHERTIPAMVVHPSLPSPHKPADQALREIVHIHPIDHSLHVTLSPRDCQLVIERGWGERHPLSGVSRVIPLPKEYLIVYAPRDDEELDIAERIIVASIGYMTNSRQVN